MFTKDTSTLLRNLLVPDKWDIRFLRLAREVSTWSKDPSKQIGAVYVVNRRIVSTGYNGFPRGIEDTEERYNDRELKYELVSHAEMNGIYNATAHGQSLRGATAYVWGLPICHECAKGIIQVGCVRTVMASEDVPDNWKSSFTKTSNMFLEAGVAWSIYDASEITL